MKNVHLISPTLIILLCAAQPAAAACSVCHSKNPKMVSMHKALQYKDCFTCHGPASERQAPNARNEKTADPLCAGCHATGTAVGK